MTMEITNLNQLDFTKTYNYADYLTWKFQERVELIKGKILKMSPASASRHQRILSYVGFQLQKHLEGQSCEVFYAPFDVRLEKNSDEKKVISVVQPDISVICDSLKIDEKGCNGSPDLVVEILSPGNSKKEMGIKFELYEAAKVGEYWIIDPENEIILQYVLIKNQFVNHKPLTEDSILKSQILKGFEMPLHSLFVKK